MKWVHGKMAPAALESGRAAMKREQYEKAQARLADAQKSFAAAYGDEHEWTMEVMALRAWCLVKVGRTTEGVKLYQDVKDTTDRVHGAGSKQSEELVRHLQWAQYQAGGTRQHS